MRSKIKPLLVCIIFVGAINLFAAPSQENLDLNTTLDKLLKQEKAGIVNADLYNQAGICYYKLGNTGKAVLYFLRALRINSNHREAKNNLAYAVNQTTDRNLHARPTFLSSLFQEFYNFFSINSLAVISLLLLLITTLCLHWIMHTPVGQDKAVRVMWLSITCCVFLLFAVTTGFKLSSFHKNTVAVLIEREVEGYSGPGQEFGKLFTLHEGLVVHINRTNKDWVLVTLPNGGAGWILSSALERVNNIRR